MYLNNHFDHVELFITWNRSIWHISEKLIIQIIKIYPHNHFKQVKHFFTETELFDTYMRE